MSRRGDWSRESPEVTGALPGITGTSGLFLADRGRIELARSFADSWVESTGRGQVTSMFASSVATFIAFLVASPVLSSELGS